MCVRSGGGVGRWQWGQRTMDGTTNQAQLFCEGYCRHNSVVFAWKVVYTREALAQPALSGRLVWEFKTPNDVIAPKKNRLIPHGKAVMEVMSPPALTFVLVPKMVQSKPSCSRVSPHAEIRSSLLRIQSMKYSLL